MSGFPRELQVMKYVAVLRSPKTGARFRVFTTGSTQHYLFDVLDEFDCSTGLQFPVLKRDLKPEYRRALRHGWGNAQ